MNTYIIPYFDGYKCSIYSTTATSYRNAESKVIKYFVNRFELDYGLLDESLKQLSDELVKQDVYLGLIYDVEEF